MDPRRYSKDYYGGGLMLLIGLLAANIGRHYNIGTLSNMGPGFFPVLLGATLALIGLAIVLSAWRTAPSEGEGWSGPEWRGWSCILLAIAAFIVTGRYGGLVPATFAIVFISALGDRRNTILGALALAAVMVAVCVAVFWWALQLQLPLFQWG